jgi:nicotinate-nucleotide adenylyltransferase
MWNSKRALPGRNEAIGSSGSDQMSENIRIGVFGGSFDPVHMGHLAIAQEAREVFALSKVMFVPAAQPPHKGPEVCAGAADRLEMVRLAIEGNPAFVVSDIEMHRQGPSYTIDTLEEIQRINPRAQLYFIAGADSLAELHTWYRATELVEKFNFIILGRPGVEAVTIESLTSAFGDVLAAKLEAGFLRREIFRISATEIRKRINENRSITYLVPKAAEAYILDKGLYR